MSKVNDWKQRLLGRAGVEQDTLFTTPWAWRTADGMYVGHNGSVWLYRTLDVAPMAWEDADTQVDLGSPLAGLLYELGAQSKDVAGIKALSKNREIHLLSVMWEEPAVVPEGTAAGLRPFLEETLGFLVTGKAVVLGVRLWSSQATDDDNFMDRARGLITTGFGEKAPDFHHYDKDRREVEEIMARYGATSAPSRQVRAQMEGWYNNGESPDATLYETREQILTASLERIEMAAVMAFDRPMMTAPNGMWAMLANNHPAGASVISVRAELQPSTIARSRVRRAERKLVAQIDEERATGDIAREENSQLLDLASTVENFILNGQEPLLANCSIVMGRRVDADVPETYINALSGLLGIEMKPLEHRQLSALDETLPASSKRTNPFLHDLSVSMLAYAGVQSFSDLGDRNGVFIGLSDPEYQTTFLDPAGAPRANLPAGMLIAGDSGSGKTFLAQAISVQSALAGNQTIFINPKADDSLEGLLDLVPGTMVNLSQVEADGGYFDPWRFTPPTPEGRHTAAEILAQHILAVLGSRGAAGQGLTQDEEIAVIAGVREGADRGAQCAAQAISCIDNAHVRDLIAQQASDPLFRLGISMKPVDPFTSDGSLLLVQFDKPLDIPEKGVSPSEMTRSQRLAVAAVRLVTRASLEMLAMTDGGTMVVDEAWMFLQSSQGLAALQSLGRLGRSKAILPIFCTQRVADLIAAGVDMESYLSRVVALKLSERVEAEAALKLCGLAPTSERVDWLRQAGAKYTDDGVLLRGSAGLFRDLKGRHAAIVVGPVPEHVREAFSTNPEDRRRRRAARGLR